MMIIILITPIERQDHRQQQQYHNDKEAIGKVDVLTLFIVTLKSAMYCWCETLRDEGLALLQMRGEPQETF